MVSQLFEGPTMWLALMDWFPARLDAGPAVSQRAEGVQAGLNQMSTLA